MNAFRKKGKTSKKEREIPLKKELGAFKDRDLEVKFIRRYVNKGEWSKIDRLLKQDDAYVRSVAAEAITQYFVDRTEWDNINGWLKHTDVNVREGATRALIQYFIKREEWDKVGELLGCTDNDIKKRAVIALNAAVILDEINPTPVLPALVSALKDKDPHMRHFIIDTLGYTDGVSATPGLISALKDEKDHNVRKNIILTLMGIARANGKDALDLVKESGGNPEVEKLIKEYKSKKNSENV